MVAFKMILSLKKERVLRWREINKGKNNIPAKKLLILYNWIEGIVFQ